MLISFRSCQSAEAPVKAIRLMIFDVHGPIRALSSDSFRMKSLFLIGILIATAAATKVRYDGYQVLKTMPLAKPAAEFLQTLQIETNLDFWKDPIPGRSADISASPEFLPHLKQMLAEHNIDFEVMIEDLQKQVIIQSPNICIVLTFRIVLGCTNPTKGPSRGRAPHSTGTTTAATRTSTPTSPTRLMMPALCA